jgi:transcriptional regulator with XRE-family HTH domain
MTDTLTINDYLDAAASRIAKLYNLKKMSDRELARKFNVSATSLFQWRHGRSLPEDAMMAQIAERAGMSVEVALMDLNAWRAEEPARSVYANLARRMGRTVSALGFCTLLAGSVGAALFGNPSQASGLARALPQGTNAAQVNMPDLPMYIMENRRRRRWRILAYLNRMIARTAYAIQMMREAPAMSRVSAACSPLFHPAHRLLPQHI